MTFENVEVLKVFQKSLKLKVNGEEVILPKSEIDSSADDLDTVQVGELIDIEIPDWLAEDRGLSEDEEEDDE